MEGNKRKEFEEMKNYFAAKLFRDEKFSHILKTDVVAKAFKSERMRMMSNIEQTQ